MVLTLQTGPMANSASGGGSFSRLCHWAAVCPGNTQRPSDLRNAQVPAGISAFIIHLPQVLGSRAENRREHGYDIADLLYRLGEHREGSPVSPCSVSLGYVPSEGPEMCLIWGDRSRNANGKGSG